MQNSSTMVTMATIHFGSQKKLISVITQDTFYKTKVSSKSETMRAGPYIDFFGPYRELLLTCQDLTLELYDNCLSKLELKY